MYTLFTMKKFTLKYITFVYMVTCFLATISLSIYSLYRYIKNEDTTSIKITTFLSTKEAIYPSLSFCILIPFLKHKFNVYEDKGINMTSYVDYLNGNDWNESFLSVDYDDVTVSLSENLIKAEYWTLSDSNHDWDVDYYVSFRSAFQKCFTINAPFPEKDLLEGFDVHINNSIFPTGSRYDYRDYSDIVTYIHYPGQRYTAYYTFKNDFDSRKNENSSYEMIYKVRNIDVISRRNKIDEPCEEDWKNFDQKIMEKRMNDVGCHPPHWKLESMLPNCTSAKDMKHLSKEPSQYEVALAPQPCRIIDRLDYTYTERDEISRRLV